MPAIRKRIARVPREPGVYRWLDAEGNVLYVGKAKNLKNRMQTYVQNSQKHSPWAEIMVRQIADFDVTIVQSELEAFMLESNLIKELKPKYNIMLKDDKGYVYVRIAVQDAYPNVEVVRRMKDDRARYFGPFLGARDTYQTLDMLDSILKFRACKKSIEKLNRAPGTAVATAVPCLEYQIGRCCGLCIGNVSEDAYRARIREVERFFRGHFGSVKKKAEEQMRLAAREQKFERAARIRDVLGFIDDLEKRQIVSDTTGANADIFAIALSHGKIQVVLLRQRDGKLIGQVSFALRAPQAYSAAEAMAQFLPQYYADTQDIPDIILVRDDLPECELLEAWFREKRGQTVRILVPERGKKSKLLEMAERNAEENVRQMFAAWEAEVQKAEGALLELQQLLGLPSPPKRIEGFDISHLGGTATVGSMVVFINGKPKREHYRSFNMQTVREGAIDDYASLAETLKRRLKYLTDHLRVMTDRLKREGIAIGKALKADQNILEQLINTKHSLSNQTVDYRDCTIAREKAGIIGFARLVEHPGKILAIESVWVKREHRGQKLGQLLVRTMLSKLKKGKVYVLLDPLPAPEEYYAEMGFRHVQNPPKVLLEKAKKFHAEHPGHPEAVVFMFEVAKHKADESFADRPDLLLIDGGKGQLSATVAVLKELQLTIPVAGLAKREEEIFIPDRRDPLIVAEGSQARFLLQRIRDEAHRFANFKRETRLKARMFESK